MPRKPSATVPEPVVAEPVVEATVVNRPGKDQETPTELPDASAGLYRDNSGPARTQSQTEGANYSSTMAKLAREAAGQPSEE